MIPYGTQSLDEDDLEAVAEVLNSSYLTTGPTVTRFEEEIAGYVKASFAVAVNSCTSALHLAMCAFNVSKGDLVYVSAISFVASANCARYCGAEVEFVDVDKFTGNLNLDYLEQMLIKARANNRLPKVVVAVDLSGRSCDMERLNKLKKEYGFYVLEDAAHALGAEYHGHMVGSCYCADITVLSFHPVKIITTAEGGMCLTNDPLFYQSMRRLSSHGIVHDKESLIDKNEPGFYYEMQSLGFNYRLSDLQAALGISQLNKINGFLQRRREIAKDYEFLLDDTNIRLPLADSKEDLSSWHLYQIQVEPKYRNALYQALRNKGIGVQIHYIPIYKQPYYQALKEYKALEGAEYFYQRTLSIPCYPKLTKLEQQLTAATILSELDKLL